MLRSAVLRSAGAVTARIARPTTSAFRASPLARQSAAVNTSFITSPWKPVIGARLYSAGGALNQQEVEQRITTLLGGFDKVNDPKNITASAHFANDLGLDSLDTVEVVMAIEEEFSIEIPDKDADAIHSVDKAVQYILSQPDAQ